MIEFTKAESRPKDESESECTSSLYPNPVLAGILFKMNLTGVTEPLTLSPQCKDGQSNVGLTSFFFCCCFGLHQLLRKYYLATLSVCCVVLSR